ncbi:MAG TPA: GvpL/GvpF family gas vesicle protein [Terriglobales bacterium]|nr:GvpL/GvpF family gas vesicle protein [Terriglobales bacterium]
MPILLYCISRWPALVGEAIVGVSGRPVAPRQSGELAAFISRAPEAGAWLQKPLRTAAVEFHRVCNGVFTEMAIIPFRFPTIFETEEDLEQHLNQHADEYHAVLAKFRDAIQMEIHIAATNSDADSKSGTNYLKMRQESTRIVDRFSDEVRETLAPVITGWRQRRARDGIRVFALLERNSRAKFETAMRASSVPGGITVRVTGPWPVSEFLEQR